MLSWKVYLQIGKIFKWRFERIGMEVEVLSKAKGEIEVKVDSVTLAEILRVYLNKQGVDFAAWKKNHLSEPAILRVEGKDVKKEISNAVNAIRKDLDVLVKGFKK